MGFGQFCRADERLVRTRTLDLRMAHGYDAAVTTGGQHGLPPAAKVLGVIGVVP
jgi:hypothetical protein